MAAQLAAGKGLRTPVRLAIWAALTAALLMVPLVAMRFDNGVDWTLGDFVFAAVLIFGSGLVYELGRRMSGQRPYRVGVALALAGAFFTVWANGAVGIIGNEDNPLNLMFYFVLAIGIGGAAGARARPRGLAAAMIAVAVAQLLVAVVAQMAGHFIWIYTGLMLAVWLVAARLFRDAARVAEAAQAPERPA